MTYNQLLLNQHRETVRTNIANEAIKRFSASSEHAYRIATVNETRRHNLATEGLTSAQLQETIRHNKQGEAYNVSNLQELARHNIANENAQMRSVLESIRHNMAAEGIDYGNLAALISHNKAMENLQSLNYEELNRHNLSSEYEIWRHNEASEDIQQVQATGSLVRGLGSWVSPILSIIEKLF